MKKKYTIKDARYWYMILSLGLASLFIFATMYFYQPILPLVVDIYDISISTASLTMSLHTIGLVIGLILIGFWSDRKGRRIFILFSILLTCTIVMTLPLIEKFFLIVWLRFIQGFILAGVLSSALAYMAEEIHPKYFGFAASLYIACNSIGGMAGRFVSSYLVEAYSFELAFYSLALFGLFTFFIVWLSLPKSKYFIQSKKSLGQDMRGFLFHMQHKPLLVMFGLGFVLQMSFTGIWTFLPFRLIEEPFGLSLQEIAYFYLAYSLGTIGAPLAGWLSRNYAFRKLRIIGILLMVVGVFISWKATIGSIILALSIICLGFFISHSLASATVSSQAVAFKGSASSLYLVSYYLGVAAGTSLLTPIWEKFSWEGIILVTSTLPLSYLCLVLWLERKRKWFVK